MHNIKVYNEKQANEVFEKLKKFSINGSEKKLSSNDLFHHIKCGLTYKPKEQIVDRACELCQQHGVNPKEHLDRHVGELTSTVGGKNITHQIENVLLSKEGCQFVFMAIVEYNNSVESHRLKNVTVLPEHCLEIEFLSGERKIYKIASGELGPFEKLYLHPETFSQVEVVEGGYGISWSESMILSCTELYLNGENV